ncbi:MAG TPA: hypothetical protein VF765_08055 [Polyangiaceae bacterium]
MKNVTKALIAGAGAAASYGTYVATTYLRYGHAKPARGAASDALLDRVMAEFDVCERHHVHVDAPAESVLAAATEQDLQHSPVIRGFFKARELLMRGHTTATRPPIGLLAELKALGWRVVAEVPGREIVVAAVTRPWEAEPTFRGMPAEQFATFAEPDYVKIAVTLRADPAPGGGATFRTETRALATDAGAARKFRPYWSLLSPGIILIRAATLPGLPAAADRRWALEGDDLIPEPRAQMTHSITIEATPAEIWPWLLQMGRRRAGWYSWDVLDNGGKRSADRIIPDLQHLAVGDVLPWGDAGPEGFSVERILPERALILGSNAPRRHGTWAFVLEPLGPTTTRLVTRYRAAYAPTIANAALVQALSAVHAFMEGKQLRSIKQRAERSR